MRALDDEVRAGKSLYVGISDTPAWLTARANTLAAWRGWTAFAGLQAPYSLLRRDIERELLPMAEALGMTVAAWSPCWPPSRTSPATWASCRPRPPSPGHGPSRPPFRPGRPPWGRTGSGPCCSRSWPTR
jgi:Aldo/keto reductase family